MLLYKKLLLMTFGTTLVLSKYINPLNAELNSIRHLLTLVEDRHIVHVSRLRVKDLS